MSEPNTPQDGADPAADGNAPHGTASALDGTLQHVASASTSSSAGQAAPTLVRETGGEPRWLQRMQAPAGVIDTGAAQHSYARHMGWAVQRMSGVGSILARYAASDAAAVGGALPLARLPIAAGTQAAGSESVQSHAVPTVSATADTLPVTAAAVVQRTAAATTAVTASSMPIARAHPEPSAGAASDPDASSVHVQSQPPVAAGLSQRLYRRLAQPGVIKSNAAAAPSPALTLRTGLHQQLLARSVDSSQPALGERRAAALPLAAPSLPASQLATNPATPVAASPASSAPLTTAAPATASSITALPSQVLPVRLPALTLQRTVEPSSLQAAPSPASMPHPTPVEASRAARTADASAAAVTGPAPTNAATVMRPVSEPQIARALDAHAAAVARSLPTPSLETSTTPLPLAKAATSATLDHATVSPTSAPAFPISAPQLSPSGATLVQRAAELAPPTAGGEALSMPVALRQPSASPVGTSDRSTTVSSAAGAAILMQRAAAAANSADLSGSSLPFAGAAHRALPQPVGTDAAAASVPVVGAAPAPGLAVSGAPALTLQRSSAEGVSSTRTVTPHSEPVAAGQMVWRKTVGPTSATQRQVTKLGSELQVMRSMMEGLQSPATATPLSAASGGTTSSTGAGTPAAPRASGVDVQQIAEQVSRILVRDLEIERERRGVKSWI